jgi:polysaccharide biosynthesis protein PslH
VKILWVKAGKLLPVDTGGKIRSYNILKHLARDHQVTLLSYYGGRRDHAYEAEIRKELQEVYTIYTAAPDATVVEQAVDYLRRLWQPAPFAVSKFTHPEVQRTVASWLNQRRFDVAVCDFLSASLNFPQTLPTPTVLFQHNLETALWQRMASTESNPAKRFAYRIEAAKMARYERAALGRFHRIIAVSDHDRQQMLQMDRSCDISVVPTGVDTRRFPVAPPAKADPPTIIFTGSMDWEPNIDATNYFCQEIFPRIRAEFPDAIFQIVGRNPHDKVRRLASESVQVTGTVASVVDYLRQATVVVVPLRIGGGTRLKIFEAMAVGKAVVSTSIGAEGLDVQSGRDLVLADNASTFADAILLLLRNSTLRRKYEEAAVELATQYDWSHIVQHFVEILEAAIKVSRSGQTAHGAGVPMNS